MKKLIAILFLAGTAMVTHTVEYPTQRGGRGARQAAPSIPTPGGSPFPGMEALSGLAGTAGMAAGVPPVPDIKAQIGVATSTTVQKLKQEQQVRGVTGSTIGQSGSQEATTTASTHAGMGQ